MIHINSAEYFSSRFCVLLWNQVIVINNQFPGPILEARTNDVVNVNIHNNLTEPFLMTWYFNLFL